jgi:ATP-dependent exoDNAse (exonuclease V) beta subunit
MLGCPLMPGRRKWREVPFAVAIPASGPGALATGCVDLVYREGDELVVVDYKTDKDVTKDM